MSAQALPSRSLKYKTPACPSADTPCEACSCGKAGKKAQIWSIHYQSGECESRSSPCSSCSCDKFADQISEQPEYKEEGCKAIDAPCTGCSCGRAAMA